MVGGQTNLITWLKRHTVLQSEFKQQSPEIGKQRYEEHGADQIKQQLRYVDSVLAKMQKQNEKESKQESEKA